MKIGVTGATGFIGQYLLRDYADEYEFVAPVRDGINVPAACRENARIFESDFSVSSLKQIFKDCDAVIHLASKGMPKNQNPLRMEDYTPNITVTANVFEACRNLKIRDVVFTSTKAVWGNKTQSAVLTEDEPLRPSDEYGVSKACCDMLAAFYNDTYGMRIKCYKMGEVCGMDLTRGMLNPFWKILLNKSIEKNAIPIYGTGAGKRELVYVKDVMGALILGLKNDVSGVFNISSGGLVSNKEIAEMFCEVFENPAGIELHPEKSEWGTDKRLSTAKAEAQLGFKARYGLKEIVTDIKSEYIRERHKHNPWDRKE